ncbi:MAG TPA: hypothetical protein VE130_06745 [Nitrososphaeraceae archaeon]|jgi:hypothetical protein|nr:hypothetical protein [Nitrososphaeraceae archaeon]
MTSTLTDPRVQNISAIVTLTNADKSEKYSNDDRSDLDLTSILPTSLSGFTFDETSAPTSTTTESNGGGDEEESNDAEDQDENSPSDDDSNSNSG